MSPDKTFHTVQKLADGVAAVSPTLLKPDVTLWENLPKIQASSIHSNCACQTEPFIHPVNMRTRQQGFVICGPVLTKFWGLSNYNYISACCRDLSNVVLWHEKYIHPEIHDQLLRGIAKRRGKVGEPSPFPVSERGKLPPGAVDEPLNPNSDEKHFPPKVARGFPLSDSGGTPNPLPLLLAMPPQQLTMYIRMNVFLMPKNDVENDWKF